MKIGRKKSRASVVRFSDYSITIFDFESRQNQSELQRWVNGIEHDGGGTDIGGYACTLWWTFLQKETCSRECREEDAATSRAWREVDARKDKW